MTPNESRAIARLAQLLEGADYVRLQDLLKRDAHLAEYPSAWQDYIHKQLGTVDKSATLKGVPGPLEVAKALSRLTILPNPIDPSLKDPEKYVESPWQTVSTPTIDPNIWDDAQIEVVNMEDLLGTDIFLKRKKVATHIESMGAAETPFRNYPLIVNDEGTYKIVDGHHRLFAQWLLGQEQAPAWVAKR